LCREEEKKPKKRKRERRDVSQEKKSEEEVIRNKKICYFRRKKQGPFYLEWESEKGKVGKKGLRKGGGVTKGRSLYFLVIEG